MTTVRDIFEYLCALAPLALQMDFDNSGLLLGHGDAGVNRALLALDVTTEVAREAVSLGAELIVSHHPLIFTALKSVTDGDADGRKLLLLAENRVAVISMHTNLDIAEGGVNDVLIRALGAEPDGALDADGCGRVGTLPETLGMCDFLKRCTGALDTEGLRYYDSGRPVSRVAVLGGAGGGSVGAAFEKGCDTYVTGDVKYHQFLEAKELGLNLIDGEHYGTENPVMPVLARGLRERFPGTEFIISSVHRQTDSFFPGADS